MELKKYIIDKSQELNIDMIGFTDCQPFENLRDYLHERKETGKEIEFEGKDIEKRINPKASFPKCKSIIVIGLSYNNDFRELPDYSLKGRLSKSSWGRDYHRVVEARMEGLIKEIEKKRDFSYQAYVDTGPLIDRELAKRAGLGYYGKNCSIINDKYGSFIFIGYIMTDLELDIAPKEVPNKCGDCTLCIKACPTGALEGPFKFNPIKCISYLTQTKEKIPYELRIKIGDKIFGCDTCQLACPKNKNITRSNHEEFIPRKTYGYVDVEEILNMTNKEFREKYASMSGAWRGKNTLKRNAIILLGNTKDGKNLDLLVDQLRDPSPMIREYAAWGILNIDPLSGKAIVERAMEGEGNLLVREEMANLLEYFHKLNISNK